MLLTVLAPILVDSQSNVSTLKLRLYHICMGWLILPSGAAIFNFRLRSQSKSVAAPQSVTVMLIRKHLLGQLVIQSACIQTCNSNFKTIFNLLTDRLPDWLGPSPSPSPRVGLSFSFRSKSQRSRARGRGLALSAVWVSESELGAGELGGRGAGNGNAFWVTLVPICPSSLPSSVTFVTTASGEPRTSGAAHDAQSESEFESQSDADADAESDTDEAVPASSWLFAIQVLLMLVAGWKRSEAASACCECLCNYFVI